MYVCMYVYIYRFNYPVQFFMKILSYVPDLFGFWLSFFKINKIYGAMLFLF